MECPSSNNGTPGYAFSANAVTVPKPPHRLRPAVLVCEKPELCTGRDSLMVGNRLPPQRLERVASCSEQPEQKDGHNGQQGHHTRDGPDRHYSYSRRGVDFTGLSRREFSLTDDRGGL